MAQRSWTRTSSSSESITNLAAPRRGVRAVAGRMLASVIEGRSPGQASLSEPQRQFAESHGARPGLEAREQWGGARFFYREDDRSAERWLVDAEGYVLDHCRFPS